MPPKAILFDFDGVIADTANHHVAAWQRTLGFMGLTVTDDVAARAEAVDDLEFLTDLFTGRGIPVDKVDAWVDRKRALTTELLRFSPRVYPGVARLVEALRGRARLAVVTGTWREDVEAVLEAAGLADAFDRIVARPDVTTRKPDPEAYTRALEALDLPAAAAAAIEDSPDGLSAARAAGIVRLIAVGHRRPPGDWIGEATFVERFTPIEKILGPLGF